MGCQTVSLMQRKKYMMTAKDSRTQHPPRLNLSGTDASVKCRKKYIWVDSIRRVSAEAVLAE